MALTPQYYGRFRALSAIPDSFYLSRPIGNTAIIESLQIGTPHFAQGIAQAGDKYRLELGLKGLSRDSVLVTQGDFTSAPLEGSETAHTHPGVLNRWGYALPSSQDILYANPSAKMVTVISALGMYTADFSRMSGGMRAILAQDSLVAPKLPLYDVFRYIFPHAQGSVTSFLNRFGIELNKDFDFGQAIFEEQRGAVVSAVLEEIGYNIEEPSVRLTVAERRAVDTRVQELYHLYHPKENPRRQAFMAKILDLELSKGSNSVLVKNILERSRSDGITELQAVELIKAFKEGVIDPNGQTKWILELAKLRRIQETDILKAFVKAAAGHRILRQGGINFEWTREDLKVFELGKKIGISVTGLGDFQGISITGYNIEDPYVVLSMHCKTILPVYEIAYFLSEITGYYL